MKVCPFPKKRGGALNGNSSCTNGVRRGVPSSWSQSQLEEEPCELPQELDCVLKAHRNQQKDVHHKGENSEIYSSERSLWPQCGECISGGEFKTRKPDKRLLRLRLR